MKHMKLIGKRNELGMSQTDVAKLLNISPATYYIKETGKRQFTLDEALQLCDIFKCKIEDIFLPLTSNEDKTEE